MGWIAKNSLVNFGSHTLNHKYLPAVPAEELRQEISGSKIEAEERYGLQLSTLAYPVGGFTRQALDEAEAAGYACAFTTNRGFKKKPHIYAIRRIKIHNRGLAMKLWIKLSGFYQVFKRLRHPGISIEDKE